MSLTDAVLNVKPGAKKFLCLKEFVDFSGLTWALADEKEKSSLFLVVGGAVQHSAYKPEFGRRVGLPDFVAGTVIEERVKITGWSPFFLGENGKLNLITIVGMNKALDNRPKL